MIATRLRRLSARIGVWPRRVAALICLLLAAGSAVVPPQPPTPPVHTGLGSRLRSDEIAVPVPVSATSAALVRPGDRVGVVAAADAANRSTLVADHLRVLAVRSDSSGLSGSSDAVVVTAATRSDALALARYSGSRLVLIVDELP
jgi:Flp pilus assembly protein CpaB